MPLKSSDYKSIVRAEAARTQSSATKTSILASIIIPVFRDIDGLEVTLRSISKALGNLNRDIEVIVSNDGGGDVITRIVESFGVREVRLSTNQGSYAARNRAIEAAKGNILVFLDADQRADDEWFRAGIRALAQADYVGGRIVVEPGPNPSTWELYDTLTAFPVESYLAKSHFAPTANLFVHRRVFQQIGMFHDRLRSGGDLEFGRRVFHAGLNQVYAPEVITFHPARNRTQQIRKIRRVAEGTADLACLVNGESPFFLFLTKMLVLAKLPFETLWCLITCSFSTGNQKVFPEPIFIMMQKECKFYLHWHIARRAIHWFQKSI